MPMTTSTTKIWSMWRKRWARVMRKPKPFLRSEQFGDDDQVPGGGEVHARGVDHAGDGEREDDLAEDGPARPRQACERP